MTIGREACHITAQDLGIAGNLLKIRANFWRGFSTYFCLEAENLLVFAVLRACRMSSLRISGFKTRRFEGSKLKYFTLFLLTENQSI